MSPLFGHGDLRLYLLKLLEESPRYGYEVIRLLEDRFLGTYTPSAGTIYPRLAALEEEGLITHAEEDGRKVYRLTEKGESELAERGGEMEDLEERVVHWTSDLTRELLGEMKSTLRGLQGDLRDSVITARRSRREGSREARDAMRDAARGAMRADRHRVRVERVERSESRGHARALRADLDAFVDDIGGLAATRPDLDRSTLRKVQEVLLDARSSVAAILEDVTAPAPATGEAASS
ncbi:MAG TPA: PadR family transcriptional regulator [Acidimicrobiales bacterium]|nr:PadR family transcriptional regulator [Acidimicrobiales bacterium]